MVNLSQILKFMYPNALTPFDYAVGLVGGRFVLQSWDEAKLGPRPTDAEIAAATPAAQVAFDTQEADFQSGENDKATLKAAVQTAITRLAQIRDAPSPTNAQVVQAVRDMAGYQIQMIRGMARLL